MTPPPGPLTFAALDNFAFAAQRGRLKGGCAPETVTFDLGPFMEFRHLAETGLLPFPEQASWLALDGAGALNSQINGGASRWVNASKSMGVFRAQAIPPKDEMAWTTFGLSVQQAIVAMGVPRDASYQLVGALSEMLSNIYEHSDASATGVIAFCANSGLFECVVSDRGIGILQSLKSCSDHAGLSDHGMALLLALSDGVSRFGGGNNRGWGFRPLFTGLANLQGSLRFRSGDHALTIEGKNVSVIRATAAQKPFLQGFFASIACRLVS